MNGNGLWRWPMMPFAAFFGAILGAFLIAALQWIGMKFSGHYNEDGWYYRYVMPVFNIGWFAFLYARIAYWVSPNHKFIAGVVMVTIMAVVFVGLVIFGWTYPRIEIGEAIQSTIGLVGWLFGACIGLAVAKSEDPE